MGKTSIRKGIEKILGKRYRARYTIVLGRTTYMKWPIHPNTYSSDLNSTHNNVYFPHRTDLKP